MNRFAAVGLSVVLLAASTLMAYQSGVSGRWKNYTDMSSVRSIRQVGSSLWAATSGGVFLYLPSSNQFTKYTSSEGLSTNDVTAAAQDRDGRLWFGTAEGYVNLYDPATTKWKAISGIAESNRVQKAIRTLYAHNDTLFIGTEFGIAVFRTSPGEFGDLYLNFGFANQPKVNDILVHQNTIWVATDSGLASASLASPNLSSPLAWSRYMPGVSSGARRVTSLAVLNSVLYAGTSGGVSSFVNGAFVEHQGFPDKSIVAMEPLLASGVERLYILWNQAQGFQVESVASETSPAEPVASNSAGRATALSVQSGANNLWVGTQEDGLAHWDGTGWSYHAPNGPASNLFSSLAVDEQGVVWAGSGISGRGAGFYRFDLLQADSLQWKNFTFEQYPILGLSPTDFERNDYYKVSVGKNGSVWASSWGRGVVEVKNDSAVRRLSVPEFSTSVTTNPIYVVIGGVAVDAEGGTWFVNRTADTKQYLARLTGDTTFTYYAKSVNPTEGRLTALVIDRHGTKWIANSEPQDKPATGLVYFNETPGIVSGTSATNGWGILSDPVLPHNTVLSLAVDRDGDVCVGTDAGMLIITNPRTPTQNPLKPLAVLGQSVQAIAVDAVNNKWVGTREGIQVLSPDGIQLLNSYTVESTGGRLLTNDIRALAIDQRRGIIYIGTEKGLSSLEIPAVEVSRSYTTLEFGPNPFNIPNDNQLVIRNLAANSSIRILTVSGTLVREFTAQGGGRAFWDGRNGDGELVSTGIYFVVAYTENGNQLTTGKIAVVRR